MLSTSKSIWGFNPRSIPGCTLWLDGADNATMNSTSAVTVWNDKSGQSNTMTGTGTWSGGTMVFNGSTNAFSNTLYAFPFGAYSMFAVYSNTTAPASTAYMNAVYGSNGYPMLGVYDVGKAVSARSVVANTGALSVSTSVGWAAQIVGTLGATNDIGYGIATDSSGNVLVTGSYGEALTLYNTGGASGATLPFTGGLDCFIAKYTSAGAVSWAAWIAGTTTSIDSGRGVATDSSGNVLVTGYYGAALTLYNTGGTTGATLPLTGTNGNCFVAKYTSAGVVSWAAQIADTGGPVGYGIATDASGNVFVTGSYGAALTLYNTGGTTGATLTFAGVQDCFVAKYTSAGTVSWAARIASTGNDLGRAIATDTSGNVFVTGQYAAALTLYNTGGTSGATLPFTGGFDCFIAKYSSAGAVVWAARIASTDSDIGFGTATDTSGNVFVTGNYGAALTLYNTGGTTGATLTNASATQDVFIAKYSSAGAVVWAAQITGTITSVEGGYAIATDTSGNVFVTGYYGAAVTLYNTGGTSGATLPFTGGQDVFVAKYSSAGAVVWAARIAGTTTSSDIGQGIATDTSGNVFVTGQYVSPLTVYNTGGTIGTTLPGTGGNGAFIAKYSSDGYIISPVPASSNVLVSATYAPSTLSPFINGTTATTLAGTTLTTTGLFLGGPSNYFNGSISEVLVFGTTLTATQRQSVEGYLATKWGLKSTLPATHTYKTIPPFNRYFNPTDLAGCSLWLDGADNSSMNSTTTVTTWNDKSGLNNTMTGTATWTGRAMTFNGSTQAFSNLAYVFPVSAYSMFGVYSNTTAPASTAYMNAVYGNGGYPMLGVYDVGKAVSARSVVANTGALGVPTGWAAQIAGTTTSFDVGRGIATDTSGNVFVTGNYGAALTLYNTGGTTGATLPFTGGNDCFIAKYSSAGAVVWAARITGTITSVEGGYAIATDTSGNVFVTGYYGAAVTLYNTGGTSGATLPFAGVSDCFIAKYSSAGAVVWAARIASTSYDYGNAIATDTSGNVFVTGYYGAALTLYNTGGTTGATLPFTGGYDVFIAKYSSAGAVVWAARIAGFGNDFGYGIATDTSGNVFVTGLYGDALNLYNTGGTTGATLPFAGVSDCFIAKYSSAGAVVWAAQIAGASYDYGIAIATDTSGNVFVTGYYGEALTLYNTGGTTGATLAFAGGADCFIAKYSSAGAVVWATRIASTSYDYGNAIATDTSGNVFVTGYYGAAVTLYNTGGTTGATLTITGGVDCFIAKYSSAGAVVWAARIAGAGDDFGYGIATDTSGNVFVTGYYDSALTLYNTGGTTGATLPFTGGQDCFIAKYNPNGYIAGLVPASSNVLVSATYTPSTFSPFINGTSATTLAGTTLAATGIYVGGPLNYFNGSISELLIYSSTLSAAQRQQVEGYLVQKWGLSAQTLSNHPYKLIPPAGVLPFYPTGLSGCVVWFDAADLSTITGSSPVTAWKDKSSNAWTATGVTGTAPTTTTVNGLNAISWSASSTLTVPSVTLNSQAHAVFVVYKASTSTNYISFFDSQLVPPTVPPNGVVNYVNQAGSNATLYGYINPTNTPYIQSAVVPNNTGNITQISYVQSAVSTTSNYITQNGTSYTLSVNQVGSSYPTTTVNYTIGNIYPQAYTLCEYIMYLGEFTIGQRQQVEGYLAWKWGYANTLPSTHPYYKFAPVMP